MTIEVFITTPSRNASYKVNIIQTPITSGLGWAKNKPDLCNGQPEHSETGDGEGLGRWRSRDPEPEKMT